MERSHGHKGPGQKVFAGVQRVAEDKPTRNIDDISLSLSLSRSRTTLATYMPSSPNA